MNINKCTRAIMWGGILSFTCHTVSATIVSGAVTGGQSLTQGGTFVKLTVPFTNSDPDNTVDLAVDILADGMGGSSGSGIVPMGSTVASHYIFFDPAATTGGTTQVGTVSFDSDIFGIITSTSNLAASDFLINTGVTYLNPTLRGLESGDSATITGLQTITVDWRAGTPGDYIRVLTDFSPGAVPIPASVWLFGSGLFGIVGIARRKKAS